jgi:hypothetical protein
MRTAGDLQSQKALLKHGFGVMSLVMKTEMKE